MSFESLSSLSRLNLNPGAGETEGGGAGETEGGDEEREKSKADENQTKTEDVIGNLAANKERLISKGVSSSEQLFSEKCKLYDQKRSLEQTIEGYQELIDQFRDKESKTDLAEAKKLLKKINIQITALNKKIDALGDDKSVINRIHDEASEKNISEFNEKFSDKVKDMFSFHNEQLIDRVKYPYFDAFMNQMRSYYNQMNTQSSEIENELNNELTESYKSLFNASSEWKTYINSLLKDNNIPSIYSIDRDNENFPKILLEKLELLRKRYDGFLFLSDKKKARKFLDEILSKSEIFQRAIVAAEKCKKAKSDMEISYSGISQDVNLNYIEKIYRPYLQKEFYPALLQWLKDYNVAAHQQTFDLLTDKGAKSFLDYTLRSIIYQLPPEHLSSYKKNLEQANVEEFNKFKAELEEHIRQKLEEIAKAKEKN